VLADDLGLLAFNQVAGTAKPHRLLLWMNDYLH
jgi:hypothetical protein